MAGWLLVLYGAGMHPSMWPPQPLMGRSGWFLRSTAKGSAFASSWPSRMSSDPSAIEVGDRVRVVKDVNGAMGLIGVVISAWSICEEDPVCCCAELATDAPIEVVFGEPGEAWTGYFAEVRLHARRVPCHVVVAEHVLAMFVCGLLNYPCRTSCNNLDHRSSGSTALPGRTWRPPWSPHDGRAGRPRAVVLERTRACACAVDHKVEPYTLVTERLHGCCKSGP